MNRLLPPTQILKECKWKGHCKGGKIPFPSFLDKAWQLFLHLWASGPSRLPPPSAALQGSTRGRQNSTPSLRAGTRPAPGHLCGCRAACRMDTALLPSVQAALFKNPRRVLRVSMTDFYLLHLARAPGGREGGMCWAK